MQFETALAPDEVQALSRLVVTADAKQAIEAKFQVVSLSKVIAEGGHKRVSIDDGLVVDYESMFREDRWGGRMTRRPSTATALVPKLAITPSRAHEVLFQVTGGRLVFRAGKWEQSVPTRWQVASGPSFRAAAPIIPAPARAVVEQYQFSLVLWEADWQPVPVPLGDPAILIPLIGDLYAVGAVWDLTELEKKVLQKAFV